MSTEKRIYYPTVYDLKTETIIEQLSDRDKKYATYMHLAGQACFPILASSISKESLDIHNFLREFIPSLPTEIVYDAYNHKGDKSFQISAICSYAAYFYHNNGNYSGFGSQKFTPRLSQEELISLVQEYNNNSMPHLQKCINDLYSLEPENITQLGWYPTGISPLYSPHDFSNEEQIGIDEILSKAKIRIENTRLVRTSTQYEVHIPSIEKSTQVIGTYREKDVVLIKGQFSEVLQRSVHFLEKAKDFTSSDIEKEMIDKLIEHYQTGDILKHIDYNKIWLKDLHPPVETILGFVEKYHDPSGNRAEYESVIAAVDYEATKELQRFVDASTEILPLLPLPPFYQRKTFVAPTYNALKIISYMTNGQFIGINLPNYTEISNVDGFKNMTLVNVQQASKNIRAQPSAKEEKNITEEVAKIHVACHELYGHGSGRLFSINEDKTGQKSLITGKDLNSNFGYDTEKGENFDTLFGDLASAFEECRAETTALFLLLTDKTLETFKISPSDYKRCKMTEVQRMTNLGLSSLRDWDNNQRKWNQAHSQARFALLKALLIWSRGALSLEKIWVHSYGSNCLSPKVADRENAFDEIKDAAEMLLKHLNDYKSNALFKEGRRFIEMMSAVDGDFLEVLHLYSTKTPSSKGKHKNDGSYPTSYITLEAYVEKVGDGEDDYLLTGGKIPENGYNALAYEITMRAIKNLNAACI